MEALSAAASIVGLIQVAGKLTVLGYGYIQGVKQASNDIAEFMREIASFSQVLTALQDHIKKVDRHSSVLQKLDDQLQGCTLELKNLEVKLERGIHGWRRMVRSLKWPLKGTETTQIIARIERHKSLFSIALATDHFSVSKSTESHVKSVGTRVQSVEAHVKSVETHVKSVNLSVKNLQDQVRAVSEAQSSRENKEETTCSRQKRREALDWLYPESFDKKHTEISERRQKDTGKWLLESTEMQHWANGTGTSKLLWGYGIPGAGKTFLSSGVIDHFQSQAQQAGYGVAHIYFDYKERDQQTPVRVLASLVKQLALQLQHLPGDIEIMYDKLEHQGKRPSLEDLFTIIITISKCYNRVFLIFDALDECSQKSQRKQLLPLFRRMGEGGINLFITSRHYPQDIQKSFADVAKVELSATGQDIRSYVLEKIEENPRAKGLIQQGGCEERIISELIDCAQGMFLLVHFHIEHLCAQTTAKQILAALDTLKNSSTEEHPLDSTYDRVMETLFQQPKPCADLAMNILSWLVKAHRTLTFQEIQIAVSIDPEHYNIDELDLPHKETILEVCASLITIDANSDTVRLAHLTVQEYLLRKSILPKDVHTKLASVCISYLSFDIFQSACISQDTLQSRLESYPFLEYVARYMPNHLARCDETSSKDPIVRFLKRPGNACAWIQTNMYLMRNKTLTDWYLSTFTTVPTSLHMAAYIGNKSVVQQLLLEGADVSALTGVGETVLHWAVQSGDVALVKLLIEHGADVLSRDNSGETTLYQAAIRGHDAVARVLLHDMKTDDILVPDKSGTTPLHVAASGGHLALVRLLLENGAETCVLSNNADTPLHMAAMNGHEEVVRTLLKNDADISAVNQKGQTPLFRAAYKGNNVIVQILLENGADILIADTNGNTPLHMAARSGNEEVVRTLLKNDADISAVNQKGQTTFFWAAYEGNNVIVQILLENGADISIADTDGDTPLHMAAMNGHEEVVRTLLKNDADISAVNQKGQTPLLWAAYKGNNVIVQILLENGADRSTPDSSGRTPLEHATKNGHEAVVKLLSEESNAVLTSETIATTETTDT